MGIKLGMAFGAVVLAAAYIGASGIDTGGVDVEAAPEVSARKHLVTDSGRMVRVTGLSHKAGCVISSGALGETVEANAGDVLRGTCNVVIRAPEKSTIADMRASALPGCVCNKSIPVMVPGSCVSGVCFWVVMLRGDDCLKAADSDHYVGSTMKEFMSMSADKKKRLLRTYGMCESKDGKHRCVVPFGDERAIHGEVVFFGGTSWAGRTDLDFYRFRNGQINGEVK